MRRLSLMCLAMLTGVATAQNVPTVSVKKAGEGEKQVLKIAPKSNETQLLTMAMEQSMEAMGQAQDLPKISLDFQIVPRNEEDKEQISYDFTVVDYHVAEGEGMMTQVITQQLAPAKGMKGWAKVRPNGTVIDSGVDGAATNMGFEESITQNGIVFPDEAVGVGAVWIVSSELSAQGIQMRQATEYTLTSMKGSVVELEIKMTQSAEPQDVTMQGMNVHVEALEGSGKGTVTFDLTRVMPIAQNVTMDVSTELSLDMGTGPQTMAQSQHMVITFAETNKAKSEGDL